MKGKFWIVLLATLFVIGSVSVSAAQKGPEFINIAGGGMGGAWYLGAAKLATFAEKIWPKTSATGGPGGGVSNLRKIVKGELDIAFTFTNTVYNAKMGRAPFKQPLDLRFIASTNPAFVQIMARPPISSFKQLAGKKINGGKIGFSAYSMTEALVDAYGLKGKTKIVSSNYDKAADLQVDGMVDATLIYGSVPHYVFADTCRRSKVNFIPVDDAIRDKFIAKNPGYIKIAIPANSYDKQTKAVQTLGSMTCIVASPKLSTDTVYKLLKYAWEHKSELVDAHVVYKEFVKKSVGAGRTIPWHPGAEKFWKEIGAIK